ncbi:hypothetical protein EDD11_010147 [Mortierella claussenii]|nr:hypothetical protein EDD11_010147 [Mortierella claussenii]
MKILLTALYAVVTISGATATWFEDSPLTAGKYGIFERDLIFDMKELYNEFHAGLGNAVKQPWMNKIPNTKFLQHYDGQSQTKVYTPWRVSGNIQQQPVGTPDNPLVKPTDPDVVALVARYAPDLAVKTTGSGARIRVISYNWGRGSGITKVTGDYRGIPVKYNPQTPQGTPGSYANIAGTVLKTGGPAEGAAASPEDPPVNLLDYKTSIDTIGNFLNGDAYETINDADGNPLLSRLVVDPDGRKVSIGKMLSRYVTRMQAGPARDSLMAKLERVQGGVRI